VDQLRKEFRTYPLRSGSYPNIRSIDGFDATDGRGVVNREMTSSVLDQRASPFSLLFGASSVSCARYVPTSLQQHLPPSGHPVRYGSSPGVARNHCIFVLVATHCGTGRATMPPWICSTISPAEPIEVLQVNQIRRPASPSTPRFVAEQPSHRRTDGRCCRG